MADSSEERKNIAPIKPIWTPGVRGFRSAAVDAMEPSGTTSQGSLLPQVKSDSSTQVTHIYPERKRGCLSRLWAETRRDVVADLRSKRWGPAALFFLYFCWMMGLVATLIVLPFWNSFMIGPFAVSSACQPGGTFSIYKDSYSIWSISGFFQITIGFGSLTFTQAKVIDIVWDIGVGRCGQAALTWYSLRAFSAYVRSAMGRAPVTYDTFWAFCVRDDASLLATIKVLRDFVTRRGLGSKAAMAFIALSMAFVLAFPTLASAMTGYTSNSGSFVADARGDFISFSEFSPVLYMIHDGWRIGLGGDYPVPWFGNGSRYGLRDSLLDDDTGLSWDIPEYRYCNYAEDPALCYLQRNVSAYVQQYGFLGLNTEGGINDVDSAWMNQTLPKPTLNISAFYLEQSSQPWGWNWTDPRTKTQPFSNRSMLSYSGPSNTTYTADYVQRNGMCQPIGSFQWGFSFLQLFVVLLLLFVWSVGVHLMWLKAYFTLARRGREDVPTSYKAAIELTQVMEKEFADVGENPETLTNKQIGHCLNRRLNGGRMELQLPGPADEYSLRKGLKGWIKKEVGWFVFMTLLVLFDLVAWVAISPRSPFYWAVLVSTVGVYFAMSVGRTWRSRLVFTFCGLILGFFVTALGILIIVERRKSRRMG